MNITLINQEGHSVTASTNTFVIPKIDFYQKLITVQNTVVSASQNMSNFSTINVNNEPLPTIRIIQT